MPARNDCCHPGPHRTFADFEFAFAVNQSGVTDLDARDVRDRVPFSRRAVEWNPKRPRANGRLCLWRRRPRLARAERAAQNNGKKGNKGFRNHDERIIKICLDEKGSMIPLPPKVPRLPSIAPLLVAERNWVIESDMGGRLRLHARDDR